MRNLRKTRIYGYKKNSKIRCNGGTLMGQGQETKKRKNVDVK